MKAADQTILDHFVDIRSKTLAILQATPEDMLSRKVNGENQPLCWQFAHIASGDHWWMHNVMKDGYGFENDYPTQKDKIVENLSASRDRVLNFFSADDGEPMGQKFEFADGDDGRTWWIGRERVLYLTAHELHHLGRAELALWQFGVTDLPTFP